jgi:hypothetical protein
MILLLFALLLGFILGRLKISSLPELVVLDLPLITFAASKEPYVLADVKFRVGPIHFGLFY